MLIVVQVTPLLGELREGDLVGNIEALTRSAAQAAADIHRLQNEVPLKTSMLHEVSSVSFPSAGVFTSISWLGALRRCLATCICHTCIPRM